jgi:hypothetical protein
MDDTLTGLFYLSTIFASHFHFASLYSQDSDWLSGLSQEKMPKVETQHTAAVLSSLGINYPNIDTSILKVYFDYLHKTNFIRKLPCISALLLKSSQNCPGSPWV